MPLKIVGLQTGGDETLGFALERLGFQEGINFRILGRPEDVPELITGSTGVFITGSFGGMVDGVGDFIARLKEKNHNLYCIGFTGALHTLLPHVSVEIEKPTANVVEELSAAISKVLPIPYPAV